MSSRSPDLLLEKMVCGHKLSLALLYLLLIRGTAEAQGCCPSSIPTSPLLHEQLNETGGDMQRRLWH